jgi:CDP-glucose 4,6-dehydratase
MQVVILAGGLGTRLREETEYRPKPLVEVGGRPIIWHIMKLYAHYGFLDFIACLGYRGNMIKEYFLNYEAMNNDFTIGLGVPNQISYLNNYDEQNFRVTLANTGVDTQTGGRIKQIEKYIEDDLFMVTYGDGLANVNIGELLSFHKEHGKLATVTFVTGGTGLLGSWLVAELVQRGARVTALIRDGVPQSRLYTENWHHQINIVRGCIEDLPTLERAINEYEVDTVFHLAAQTIVGVANREPLATFEANIKGTWNLLEACRRVGGVSRIVVASSDKAYGDQEILPYDETTPLQGEHPYDVSKSCADLICRTYFVSYGLPVCITRCGNFYGGGDLNFNRIVPDTIRSALRDKPVTIRSDGSYIRDYFYVRDGVLAYLHLAEQMERKEIWGEAFNFSNELQITVLELVQKILALMDKKDLEPVILNQAKNEIKHQYLSAKKAREMLNWKPQYSLDECLQETIKWYQDFLRDRLN